MTGPPELRPWSLRVRFFHGLHLSSMLVHLVYFADRPFPDHKKKRISLQIQRPSCKLKKNPPPIALISHMLTQSH